MKKRFAAAAIAVILGIVFLFGQGAVQKVRLWDTNLSHSLLFNWNENDTAGRTLNWLVGGADRSFTISGDSYIDQDVRIAATPYHAGLYLSSSSVAPFLKLTNASDTARDPIVQYAVGATPVTRWTHGLDDSLSNDWLLCAGDILTDTVSKETYILNYTYDGFLVICDTSNYRIKKHLSADALTYVAKIGTKGSGDNNFNYPRGICSDGTWVYIADRSNHRIKKHLLSDLSYVAQVGSLGSGDNNFNIPVDICTDGTHLYIVDQNNDRIKKHLCSDLSYVAQTAGPGFNTPARICTDGTFVYTVQTSGATYRIFKHWCDDLSLSLRVMPAGTDGHIDSSNLTGLCTTGGYLYILCVNANPAVFVKYSCSNLTYDSQFGAYGTGDGQFNGAYGISTDGTNLYVSDTGNDRIQKILLNGTYVSKFGSYGSGDNNFNGPQGLAVSGTIVKTTDTVYRAPMIRGYADGSAIDIYPLLRARDGFQLMEDGTVGATDYIGIYAPAAITASYSLTFPGTGPAAAGHFAVGSTGLITWGQSVITTASPAFDHLHLSAVSNQIVLQSAGITGTITATPTTSNKVWTLQNVTGTIYQTGGTDVAVADGGTGVSTLADGGLVIGNVAGAVEVVAAGLTTQILVGGGALTAPVWGTDIPTAVTIGGQYVYRAAGTDVPVADGGTNKSSWTLYAIPYASGTTTIGEIAIGTAGKVLAVNVGATGYEWASALSNPMTDIGDMIIGGVAGVPAKLADVAVGSYLRSGGVTTAPLWSTLTLPNTGTAYRLPVFSATNVMTELAAVGATGEYLKGNTGAIPSWATLNQAAVAGLTTASTPTFAGVVIPDGGTVGQAAGPLVAFDDTNNYLEITGCNVGINDTAPAEKLDVGGNINVTGVLKIDDVQVVGNRAAHIIDADGTLADITTKFNTLLGYLETHGLLGTS